MQRKNGDWEGNDLESKGYRGTGQGAKGKRLAVDSVYEVAKKEGKLDSASILGGIPLPWTSKAANSISNNKPRDDGVVKKGQQATAGRQLSAKQLGRTWILKIAALLRSHKLLQYEISGITTQWLLHSICFQEDVNEGF